MDQNRLSFLGLEKEELPPRKKYCCWEHSWQQMMSRRLIFCWKAQGWQPYRCCSGSRGSTSHPDGSASSSCGTPCTRTWLGEGCGSTAPPRTPCRYCRDRPGGEQKGLQWGTPLHKKWMQPVRKTKNKTSKQTKTKKTKCHWNLQNKTEAEVKIHGARRCN